MNKVKVSVTLDPELLEEAKVKGLNVSQLSRDAILDALKPLKKNFAESCLKVICCQCLKEFDKGYICHHTGLGYCVDCEKKGLYVKRCSLHPGSELFPHIHTRYGNWDKDESITSPEDEAKRALEEAKRANEAFYDNLLI